MPKTKEHELLERMAGALEEIAQTLAGEGVNLSELKNEAEELPKFTEEPPKPPACLRCGHNILAHEPISEKACFGEEGCGCKGWKAP